MKNVFRRAITYFTPFERVLWLCSVTLITVAFCVGGNFEPLPLIASLLGVSALIFIAKGNFVGQIMMMVFSVLYGIISIRSRYYGEMITYLFMSLPAALFACVSWIKNPSSSGKHEVKIATVTPKKWIFCATFSLVCTVVLFFVLRHFHTARLAVSTLSVTTSTLAASLLFFRSPYYAIAYAFNDIVLVVLWVFACFSSLSALPMVVCFSTFLCNDTYSFINWKRMQKRQSGEPSL